jgi:thiol-disulfide isomerase/thioredoxin
LIKRTLILALLCCIGFTTSANAATTTKSPATDFTLKSNSGKNIKLSELRGQVVMINFWASWCGPCRQEMPLLEQLYKKYQPMGFTLLGVNVEENSNDAIKWLKGMEVSFPVLFDNESKVSDLYNVSAMPTTLIIDRDGNMRYYHRGYVPGTEDEYQQQIRALLKE